MKDIMLMFKIALALIKLKLINFYLKYKLVILITTFLTSLFAFSGLLYYLWIIYKKTLVASAIITSPKGQEILEITIKYHIDATLFLKENMPNTGFRNWLHAVFSSEAVAANDLAPANVKVFFDSIGRAYYVIDSEVVEIFAIVTNQNGPALIEGLARNIMALDPQKYGAYQETLPGAMEVINNFNNELNNLKSALIVEAGKDKAFFIIYAGVLMVGGVALYAGYKLITNL